MAHLDTVKIENTALFLGRPSAFRVESDTVAFSSFLCAIRYSPEAIAKGQLPVEKVFGSMRVIVLARNKP
jgi:hypothetical protein